MKSSVSWETCPQPGHWDELRLGALAGEKSGSTEEDGYWCIGSLFVCAGTTRFAPTGLAKFHPLLE